MNIRNWWLRSSAAAAAEMHSSLQLLNKLSAEVGQSSSRPSPLGESIRSVLATCLCTSALNLRSTHAATCRWFAQSPSATGPNLYKPPKHDSTRTISASVRLCRLICTLFIASPVQAIAPDSRKIEWSHIDAHTHDTGNLRTYACV